MPKLRASLDQVLVKAFQSGDFLSINNAIVTALGRYHPFLADIVDPSDGGNWRTSLDAIDSVLRSAFVGYSEQYDIVIPPESEMATLWPPVKEQFRWRLKDAWDPEKKDLTGVTAGFFSTFELLVQVKDQLFAGSETPLTLHQHLFVALYAEMARVLVKTLMEPPIPF